MKCITPMFRRYSITNHSDGKIVPRAEVMQSLNWDPNYIRLCLNQINAANNKYQYEIIPCKKCWACQLNYSANWATRIMLEAKKSENNYFLTLTYNDENLPVPDYIVNPDGVKFENDGTWNGTLVEVDMIRFINTLRKHFEREGKTNQKYFYAAEYGETTKRPHYHIILLNCPLDIKEFYDCHIDTNFKAHWKSHEIEKWWNKGIIDIAEVEWSSAAYVARYCTKKLSYDVDKDYYYMQGKIPEFVRMSKGIGFDYYSEHKMEIYEFDEIIMRTVKGNIGANKPPEAFDKKLKEENPEMWQKIRKSRKKCGERNRKYLEKLSDYTDKNKMIMDAERLKTKMSLLPRVGEW